MRLCKAALLVLLCASPALAQIAPGIGTVIDSSPARRYTQVSTIGFAAFACNATTCDVTIATIPKRVRVVGMVADLTQAFVCAGTCTTSTLSFTTGKTAGGAEYLASIDADAAAATKGLANADLGASLTTTASTPILGGDLPSWTAQTTIQTRMTSGTGAVGNGTVTNFNAGSITFYLTVEAYP